jgi:hypothetical protein
MSFTEKMAVGTLVLDYLKVVLGYPVLILGLCILFRKHIRSALDALQELTFPGGSMKLRERTEVQKFQADITEQTKVATEYATVQLPPQPAKKAAEAIASFFRLAARMLPLIPKDERQKFIVESTGTLPEEYKEFREALSVLADHAPEVRALNARDVIITPRTGAGQFGGGADTPLTLRDPPGTDYKT